MFEHVVVKTNKINFILSPSPTQYNILEYSKMLKKQNVKYVVNLCGTNYDTSILDEIGVSYRPIHYPDGSIPTDFIIKEWKQICDKSISEYKNIAVHCISGLGRAPTLICFYLVYYEDWTSHGSIEHIRKLRKGSINSIQLNYILNIKKKKNCCVIS
jgi:protein tyrosine phosphatase type 4A